jgi:Xaa-Pro aminopeptidase
VLDFDDRTGVSRHEFQERCSRVAAEAAERGLDAVLAWSRGGGSLDAYSNVLYLTNHYSVFPSIPDQPPHWDAHSLAAVLVTREGEAILVSDLSEWRRDLVTADRVIIADELPRATAQLIADLHLDRARIGLVGEQTISLASWRTLSARIPGVEFVKADDILEAMRSIKSEAEIGVIRQAGEIASAAMTAMMASCVPGATEAEVALSAYQTVIPRGGQIWDMPMASGPYANAFAFGSIPSWTTRRLEEGDFYSSDLYGAYHGYFFDFIRSTVVGGRASTAQIELIEAVTTACDAVIDGLRPGTTMGDAFDRGAAAVRDAGYDLAFPSLGHGLGLGLEWPWMFSGNPVPIEPNMYLAIEALVSVDGVGYGRFEENVLITPTGPEVLTRAPRRPWEA